MPAFIIEAMIRNAPEEPYYKMAFVDECPDVDLHMSHLVRQGYSVASIKSRPASEVEIGEYMHDTQGNTNMIERSPVLSPAQEIKDEGTSEDSTTD